MWFKFFSQCIYMPYVPVFMHKLVIWPHPLLDNCSHFKNNGKLHQYVFVFLKYWMLCKATMMVTADNVYRPVYFLGRPCDLSTLLIGWRSGDTNKFSSNVNPAIQSISPAQWLDTTTNQVCATLFEMGVTNWTEVDWTGLDWTGLDWTGLTKTP